MKPLPLLLCENFSTRLSGGLSMLLLGILVSLSGCMPQLIRADAMDSVRNGDYEKSLSSLKAGLNKYPDNTELKAAAILAEDEIGKRLLQQAKTYIALTQYEQAKDVVRRLQAISPAAPRLLELQEEIATGQAVAAQLKRAERLLDDAKPGQAAQALDEIPKLAATQYGLIAQIQSLRTRIAGTEASNSALSATKVARFVNASTVSFDFRAAPVSAVLEAIRKDANINFVLDRDVKADTRITMFVKNARVDYALDLVLSAAQLSRRMLDAKTLLIYPNTPEKVREHEELVVKVFRLNHVDARSTSNMLKAMVKVKEPFVDEKANSIMLRDSPDVVAIAEQLIAMHDVNEGELMLEIEVLEIKRSRLTEIGLNFPNSFSVGPAKATGWVGLTGNWWNDYRRGLLEFGAGNLLGNFKREVGDFSVLANPKLRVKSREKAKILIGDKVPVVTTTTSNSGAVSDNITYLDVGIKLEAEPTISPNNEILLKLGLEVSTLAKEVRTSSGALAYQIGTRNANTVLRLRDGETQLLGGLISNEDRSSSNRVPGLGDVPLVGRLFSSQKDDVQNTELVLAVTPRLIRSVSDEPKGATDLLVGTEALPRMRERQRENDLTISDDQSRSKVPLTPKETLSSGAMDPAGINAPGVPREVESAPGLSLSWKAPSTAKVGEVTEVLLNASIGLATRAMALDISYSPKTIEIVDVGEAGLFRQGDDAQGFTKAVHAQEGRISAGLLRTAEKGVTGAGSLLRIQFKAKEPGAVSFRLALVNQVSEAGTMALEPLPVLTIQVP